MENLIMERTIDEFGRIIIPKELRHKLDINEMDKLEISILENSIILKKSICCCIFCNSEVDLISLKKNNICLSCIEDLSKAKKGEHIY